MSCFVIIKQLTESRIIESLCKNDLTGTACFDPRKTCKKRRREKERKKEILTAPPHYILYRPVPPREIRFCFVAFSLFTYGLRTQNIPQLLLLSVLLSPPASYIKSKLTNLNIFLLLDNHLRHTYYKTKGKKTYWKISHRSYSPSSLTSGLHHTR